MDAIENNISDDKNVKPLENSVDLMSSDNEEEIVNEQLIIPAEVDVDIPEVDSDDIKETQEIRSTVKCETDEQSKEVRKLNDDFTASIYKDTLAPQLVENEDLKREHKKILMKEIFDILKVQFRFTYWIILLLIVGTLASSYLEITPEIVVGILDFIKFYITSVVVELVAILFFIVKNVFDKSIVDLIKDFDKRKK